MTESSTMNSSTCNDAQTLTGERADLLESIRRHRYLPALHGPRSDRRAGRAAADRQRAVPGRADQARRRDRRDVDELRRRRCRGDVHRGMERGRLDVAVRHDRRRRPSPAAGELRPGGAADGRADRHPARSRSFVPAAGGTLVRAGRKLVGHAGCCCTCWPRRPSTPGTPTSSGRPSTAPRRWADRRPRGCRHRARQCHPRSRGPSGQDVSPAADKCRTLTRSRRSSARTSAISPGSRTIRSTSELNASGGQVIGSTASALPVQVRSALAGDAQLQPGALAGPRSSEPLRRRHRSVTARPRPDAVEGDVGEGMVDLQPGQRRRVAEVELGQRGDTAGQQPVRDRPSGSCRPATAPSRSRRHRSPATRYGWNDPPYGRGRVTGVGRGQPERQPVVGQPVVNRQVEQERVAGLRPQPVGEPRLRRAASRQRFDVPRRPVDQPVQRVEPLRLGQIQLVELDRRTGTDRPQSGSATAPARRPGRRPGSRPRRTRSPAAGPARSIPAVPHRLR